MLILLFILMSSLFEVSPETSKKCRERSRPVSSNDRDLYKVVDATLNQKLILECHYCDENDDSRPRNWYKIDKLGVSSPHEVVLGMENDMELNRLQVNTEHSLIINNFSSADVGLYYCTGFEQQDKDEKFNYLVDLVFDMNTSAIETGDVKVWTKYYMNYLSPINALYRRSDGKEFRYIRDQLRLTFQMMSEWDPWGPCQVCGRPKDDAIKTKKGYCRIKITRNTRQETTSKPEELYFMKASIISCRSTRLYQVFPGISNMTRVIPDFVQDMKCSGTCNPDSEGVNKGWKVGKTKGFKYRKTFVLPEGSHVTLVCPDSSLENTVSWRYRGKVLKSGDASDPHVIVDTFSTLYLVDLTEEQAGNYTCQVDDIKMQQVIVFVVQKSRLLTHELVRHLGYLGFILSLTGTCYCAGLIITYNRRKTFKTFEELIREHPEDMEEYEHLV